MEREDFFNKITYDLCVVGSGPAGIIVALEYSEKNPSKKILLVEYGNKEQTEKNDLDDSIKIVNPKNHHDPYECTNKGLGGTSATWGGRCVMYDEIDFIPRPIVNNGCTWDTSLFEEIKPYTERSAFYFECGKPVFDLHKVTGYSDKRIAENFKEGIVKDSVLERWSMPTRFGNRYRTDIENRPNITLLEGFEARDFSKPGDNAVVSYLTLRNTTTKEIITVKAACFVLAAGAQESTRILLRNKQIFNHKNQVPFALGKFYQGHVSGKIASIRFTGDPKKTDFSFTRASDGIYLRRRLQFSDTYLKEQNLLNIAMWLDNPLYHEPKHRSGAMSFMYLAMLMPVLGKKLAPPAVAHSITKGKRTGVRKHLWNIIKDLPFSLTTPASIFIRRYLKHRKLPGIFLYSADNCYALHFHSEQIPVEKNTMTLDTDNETLIIDYSLTDADIDSIIKTHKELDAYLRELNCGMLEYWFSPDEVKKEIYEMSRDGIHQSGTTRIADSIEQGVVDKNLKVFGTDNIYVCSSSVFPTSGQANPTFLLGAFAVRLSNYLSKIA